MYKAKLINLLASFIFLVRKRSLINSRIKWVVCSGSVGKTMMRKSLFLSLSKIKTDKFITLNSDYCNELGVICSLLSIQNFSVFSLQSWMDIFMKQPIQNSYVLIELGADFRFDIDWFLKRWSPSVVILTMGTDYAWTQEINNVLSSRLRLCQSILDNGKIYISEFDDVHISLLESEDVVFNKVSNNKNDVYSYPQVVLKEWSHEEGWEEQAFIPFNKNRFEITKFSGLTIIKDTYKVTPVCFAYFLKQVLQASGDVKILIITEIRPREVSLNNLYKNFLADMEGFNKIYFYGNEDVFDFLAKNLNNVFWLDKEKIATEIISIKNSLPKNSVLGIKTSAFYKELKNNLFFKD